MYKLNPAAYGSVFVLPDAVVENYIFLSSELQLKVLLLIAKNNLEDNSPAFLSKYLKKNEDDVKDAIDFWVSEGILISDGEQPKPIKTIEKGTKKEPEEEKKEVSSIPIVKPTMEQVEARLKESKELEYLFNEAQKMLGRTIGWDGQSRLLMVHDYYGLPVDVILMMLSFLKETGRTTAAEITKTAKIWAENEINTHEAANGYIDRMNSANAVFDEIKQRYGIKHERPSARQAQYISEWLEAGFSNALILRAYDEMVDKTEKPSFAYVNKILLNWNEQGVKTTDDVDRLQKANVGEKKKNGKKDTKTVSYDIEKAKQKAKSRKLKYEKKVTE